MKIDDNHLYHGAALIQIAEHPQFTAINALRLGTKTVRVGYKINDDIAVYFKYAGKPRGSALEYQFTFTKDQLAELNEIAAVNPKAFIALICVKDREVCCISYAELRELVERRRRDMGRTEDSTSILVTAPKGGGLRVYVNAPGRKGKLLGKAKIVSRKAYPDLVFG